MTNLVQDHPSVVSKNYILNANDRCDKCEAQALVRVKGLSGQLTFCNHHYEKIMNNPDSHKKMMAFLFFLAHQEVDQSMGQLELLPFNLQGLNRWGGTIIST
jgi:hypothetical protein